MLPNVRDVLLRSRPDGSAAADRVAALLPATTGGWLPPEVGDEELLPGEPLPEEPVDEELLPEEGLPEEPVEEEPLPEEPVSRSWSGSRSAGHTLDTTRWRLDPGRRGALALALVALLAALAAGGVALRARPQEVAVPVVETAGVPLPGTSATPSADPGGEVVVAVAGKVRTPGLVRLPAGSRVDDAVRAAGGALNVADTGLLNLARRLVDGEQVLVGIDPPQGAAPAAGASGAAAGGLLDLNLASVSDLDGLTGIGPVLAQRIVDWRTENGRFASVDQLREVTGIGEAKYRDLEAEVTV